MKTIGFQSVQLKQANKYLQNPYLVLRRLSIYMRGKWAATAVGASGHVSAAAGQVQATQAQKQIEALQLQQTIYGYFSIIE